MPIKYTSGYKYQLLEDYTILLPNKFIGRGFDVKFMKLAAGILTIRAGYAWDGASGPTIDTKTSMRGALVHDALYQAMREDLIPRSMKVFCDQLMHDLMVEDGMMALRAWLWLRAVKKFGLSATIANKDIMVAP